MPNLGAPELILILVVVMLVFGVGKLPEVGGALGRSIREFRRASSDFGEALASEPPTDHGPASAWRCPACGAGNPLANGFCGACGTKTI